MHSFSDQKIINYDFILDDKKEMYYLGPNLVLEQCNVIFKVSAQSIIMHHTGIQLIGCEIHAKRPLVNMRWLNANLQDCTFHGKLRGNDFGCWPEARHPNGGIRNCDLTDCELDGCRFIGCDISTIRFPGWPHFVIVDPKKHIDLFDSQTWPTQHWQRVWIEVLRTQPAEVSAVVDYLPAQLKGKGGSDKDIRTILERVKELAPGSVLF